MFAGQMRPEDARHLALDGRERGAAMVCAGADCSRGDILLPVVRAPTAHITPPSSPARLAVGAFNRTTLVTTLSRC
jgi:hypothetical protein